MNKDKKGFNLLNVLTGQDSVPVEVNVSIQRKSIVELAIAIALVIIISLMLWGGLRYATNPK